MTWKLYYDGGCNLCHASKLRLEHWAERVNQPLEVDILQSDDAINKGYADAMTLEADGKVYQAADAWLRIMAISPWYLRWVGWMGLTPPTKWLAKFLYGIVAKLRFRLFGRRACPLPARKV